MIWQKRSWTLLLLSSFFFGATAGECEYPQLDDNLLLTDEAIMQNKFLDGSSITLECPNGYDQFGSDIITCKDGQWSKPDLICKKKNCGFPKASPNMEYYIPNGTLFGAAIKPICTRGYYLQGSSYRHCLATGWSGESFCLVISCGVPPSIPHAQADKPRDMIHSFGDIIKYVCEPSLTLVGNDIILCQDTGKYTLPLPHCINASGTTIVPDKAVTRIANVTTQYFQDSDSTDSVRVGPVIMSISIVCVAVFCVAVCVLFILWQHHKRKGSYILASTPSNDIGTHNRTVPVYADPEASM